MRFLTRFLPNEPDVLGLLVAQAEITVGGMSSLVAWAEGESGADLSVRVAEHEADARKAELAKALREAFVTPVAAEDIWFLSSKLDAVLGGAKDIVREAEAFNIVPDAACRAMAELLAEGVGDLLKAFEALREGRGGFDRATAAAEAAHKGTRQIERIYRDAMVAILAQDDIRELIVRREIYGRLEGLTGEITRVSDRVGYMVVKES